MANTISSSGYTTAFAQNSTCIQVSGSPAAGVAGCGGQATATASFTLIVPALSLPSDSTFTSLTLNFASGWNPESTFTNVQEVQQNDTYLSQQIPNYTSVPIYVPHTSCSAFGGCHTYYEFVGYQQVLTGYTNVYATGTPADVVFSTVGGAFALDTITAGATTVPYSTNDLLAAGLGPDIAAGNPVVLHFTGTLELLGSINSYGDHSLTTFNVQFGGSAFANGSVSADYSLPQPALDPPINGAVPEPASLALLGTGLAGAAGIFRRKLLR